MAIKTTSTRDQILSLIKRRTQLTVSAMAVELEITEMAVRRHLNTLERDGIVETNLLRQAMGRPTHIYQLSHDGHEMFPRDYGKLTIELLRDLVEMDGSEKVLDLFERRKDRIRQRYENKIQVEDFEQKVYELARLQSENGYMAEVIKEDDNHFILAQYNCPIADVAKEFPMVCQSELALFQDVLNTKEIHCETCMSVEQESHCYYRIKKSN